MTDTNYKGIVLEDYQVIGDSIVRGNHKIDFLSKVNKSIKSLFNIEDEIYESLVGKNRDYIFDYENCQVINYYNATFVEDVPLSISNQIDLTQNVILDRAISDSTEKWFLFINGYACYEAIGTGTSLTPFVSRLPTNVRDKGFIFIAASNDNSLPMTITTDRVKLTFSKIGGGTVEVWISLKSKLVLDVADWIFFDKYGNSYKDSLFNKKNFLSSFSFFDSENFNKGAIVNELGFLEGYGIQIANFFNFVNADGYELSYIGNKWFNIKKRVGETDKNYIDRIVASIIGEKTTPYALKKALLVFSPNLVNVLEGIRGFGFVGRSFLNFTQEIEHPTGVYTGIVKPAFIGSGYSGLLHVRIQIESNEITEDPINARFIYELVQSIIMAGVTFEIQKI